MPSWQSCHLSFTIVEVARKTGLSPDTLRYYESAWLLSARRIVDRHLCTVSQVAHAWAARQRGITALVVGPRTVVRLEDCRGALSTMTTSRS